MRRLPHVPRRRSTVRHALGIVAISVFLAIATAVPVGAASPPANVAIGGATPLAIGHPIDFDSTDATESPSDPADCNGSHGPFPGPYFASVWFSYTATNRDRDLMLSAPTVQGDPLDFLAITFVYASTGGGLTLVDCTAFGNDAEWQPTAGTTYLIMEAGLSSAVTDYPPLSDRGGHGTIALYSSATTATSHYRGLDRFSYTCDFGQGQQIQVNGAGEHHGVFTLKSGHQGDPTPYLTDNYSWYLVSTNPANGKWFREDGNGIYKDLHITNVEGTVYTFVSQETGQPYSLTDMNGNRVFFDRGRLLTTFQVDTKGDADLSNDEFIDGSYQLLSENGAHPGYFFGGDWCTDIVQPLLGD
jgi:hypothetical protein